MFSSQNHSLLGCFPRHAVATDNCKLSKKRTKLETPPSTSCAVGVASPSQPTTCQLYSMHMHLLGSTLAFCSATMTPIQAGEARRWVQEVHLTGHLSSMHCLRCLPKLHLRARASARVPQLNTTNSISGTQLLPRPQLWFVERVACTIEAG